MNNTYNARLEEMLTEITKELSAIGIHNPENPSDWIAVPEELDAEEPDQNLAADSVEAWDGRNALVATLETQYNNIKRALAKVESGTFGACEICGNQIEEKRLTVSPVARTCIEHKEEETTISKV